jgi:hypothetical protein
VCEAVNSALQAGGRRFEPCFAHQISLCTYTRYGHVKVTAIKVLPFMLIVLILKI